MTLFGAGIRGWPHDQMSYVVLKQAKMNFILLAAIVLEWHHVPKPKCQAQVVVVVFVSMVAASLGNCQICDWLPFPSALLF